MPTPAEITRHHEPAGDAEWVAGGPTRGPIEVVPYDPAWPDAYARVAALVRGALGEDALDLEHVGSTSVPGLPAKPVIDVDLTVADSGDEAAYLDRLEDAGFRLVVREPSWHQHRCLTLADPRTNLHVFSPGCPEVVRNTLFRDWLREHPDDLARYRDAKLGAAAASSAAGEHVMEYNKRKEPVIRDIHDRLFRAHGLLG
jgi:GrpB-like predicted nucleotidyltransferase (UPF0157 family)